MSDDLAVWLRAEIRGDLGAARHILDVRGARPDPRREMHDAIADCEAKLAILDYHVSNNFEKYPECTHCAVEHWPCRTVRLLASGYRHRDGYRQGWKP